MLEELDLNRLNQVFNKYQGEEGALIPVLQEAQVFSGADEDCPAKLRADRSHPD